MTIHIVLVNPKIPGNTGNIIRLCTNTGAQLHLIKPLGFNLDDKKLRRAGLDYHEYANILVYENWSEAQQSLAQLNCHSIVALTTKKSQSFYDYNLQPDKSPPEKGFNIALVFGSETAGLPEHIRQDIGANNWLRLPMLPDSRSLNLSNAVAICLYEVWRQQGFVGDEGFSTGYETLTPYNPK